MTPQEKKRLDDLESQYQLVLIELNYWKNNPILYKMTPKKIRETRRWLERSVRAFIKEGFKEQARINKDLLSRVEALEYVRDADRLTKDEVLKMLDKER
jgi:hypothetical protein